MRIGRRGHKSPAPLSLVAAFLVNITLLLLIDPQKIPSSLSLIHCTGKLLTGYYLARSQPSGFSLKMHDLLCKIVDAVRK